MRPSTGSSMPRLPRHNDFSWRNYLPRAKARRGWRRHKGGSPANFIQNRVSITCRPPEAGNRSNPGHWEADLMLFAKYGQAVLTLHDRTSRILIGQRPTNKTAPLIASCLKSLLGCLPQPLRQTITFDNGTEFAHHSQLHGLNLQTFFCDTYSPWQKGACCRTPSDACAASCPAKPIWLNSLTRQFNTLIAIYNNTPRKCLKTTRRLPRSSCRDCSSNVDPRPRLWPG